MYWQKKLQTMRIYIFSVILVLIPHVNNAETVVSGIQSGIWSTKGNPYLVTDDILVPQGLTLTIEPGVIIKFAGPYRFIIAGAIIAQGTLANRIVFTSGSDIDFEKNNVTQTKLPQSSYWYGIDFTDTSDDFLNKMEYCIIRYCQYGINCHDAYPLLMHIIFGYIADDSLKFNKAMVPIQTGADVDYITMSQRPTINPVAEPPPKLEERQKEIEQEKMAHLTKIKDDSIRIANKIKPTNTACGLLVFDAEDIERFSFDNLPEILSFLPGFINTTSSSENSVPTCRGIFPGLFNNRILVLFSGVPIYDGVSNSNYFDFIPIYSIEKVETYRKPNGTHYGKNAFAGTINIFLNKNIDKPLQMTTVTTLGSFFTKKISSHIALKKGIFNFSLGSNYQDDNGYWRTNTFDKNKTKFPLKYENDNYNLLVTSSLKNFNLIASYYKRQLPQFNVAPIWQYNKPTQREGLLFNFIYSQKLSENFSTALNARFNKTKHLKDKDELSENYSTVSTSNFTINKGHLYQADAKMKYHTKKFSTSFGCSVEQSSVDDILSLSKGKDDVIDNLITFRVLNGAMTEFSIFMESAYNLSPFWGCIGGVRYSYLGTKESYLLSPNFRLIYNPFASYHVQLSYQHGFRNPSLWERHIYLKKILYHAQNLKPEQIHSYEISVEYDNSLFGQFGINGYWENISQFIMLRELAENEKIKYETSTGYMLDNSTIGYHVIGGELSFQGKLNKMLSMFINGTYQRVEDNYGHKIYNWPNILANLRISYCYPSYLLGSIFLQYIGNQTANDNLSCYLLNLKIAIILLPKVNLEVIGNNLLNNKFFYTEFDQERLLSFPSEYPRAFFVSLRSKF